LSIAALAPITPEHLKIIFELYGYKVIAEDKFNWVLDLAPVTDSAPQGEPIILPKLGDLVSLEVLMDSVFSKAGMDLRTYLALKDRARIQGFGNVH
jgi:hypothetical protein